MIESYENEPMLKTLLSQEGFRLTTQRQKILELFQNNLEGQHLSAEEIRQKLLRQGENIAPSTIYRAIHIMVKLGLLRELELAEDRKYYELSAPFNDQHHHLVCVQCAAVTEFEEDMMAKVGATQAEARGYALLDCQFTVYGICPACQQES